jgi:hypothetical protein
MLNQGKVLALPMALGIPDPPASLGLTGRRLWALVWEQGGMWISPRTDATLVELTCQLLDDAELARERYRATRDPKDARVVALFAGVVHTQLSSLGFTPTARARLGVAEVKAASRLDELIERNAERRRGGQPD